VATYKTMAVTRPIQITSGDVLIVDEGTPESAASHLILPAPPQRGGYEQGADGSTLRIISTCAFKHTVRTPPNAIGGHASLLKFAGLGAVLGLISQHNLQLEILVAGTDDSGSHLFTVLHPGILLPLETTGYGAIGSGGVHAAVRLSLGQQNKQASLVDTVYNVYEAKKAAEVAPGVGTLTDMAIIKDGKVRFVKPAMFTVLEKVHKEKPIMTEAEQEELGRVCDDCTTTSGD
jgi:hypothetical protein